MFDAKSWYFQYPANLPQQQFKRMAEEATRMKEEETHTLDVDDITVSKDDAVNDIEMILIKSVK